MRLNVGAGLIAGAVLLMTPLPVRAQQSDVLYACLNPGNGGVRVVAASDECRSTEIKVLRGVELLTFAITPAELPAR